MAPLHMLPCLRLTLRCGRWDLNPQPLDLVVGMLTTTLTAPLHLVGMSAIYSKVCGFESYPRRTVPIK